MVVWGCKWGFLGTSRFGNADDRGHLVILRKWIGMDQGSESEIEEREWIWDWGFSLNMVNVREVRLVIWGDRGYAWQLAELRPGEKLGWFWGILKGMEFVVVATCWVALRLDSGGFRKLECLWGCDFSLTLGSYKNLGGWSGIFSNLVVEFGSD